MKEINPEDIENIIRKTLDLEDLVLKYNKKDLKIQYNEKINVNLQSYAKYDMKISHTGLIIHTTIDLAKHNNNIAPIRSYWSITDVLKDLNSANTIKKTEIMKTAKEQKKIIDKYENMPKLKRKAIKDHIEIDANYLLNNFIELSIAVDKENVQKAKVALDNIKEHTQIESAIEIESSAGYLKALNERVTEIIDITRNIELTEDYKKIYKNDDVNTTAKLLDEINRKEYAENYYYGNIPSELLARDLIKNKIHTNPSKSRFENIRYSQMLVSLPYAAAKFFGGAYLLAANIDKITTHEATMLMTYGYTVLSALSEVVRGEILGENNALRLKHQKTRFLPSELAGLYKAGKWAYEVIKE